MNERDVPEVHVQQHRKRQRGRRDRRHAERCLRVQDHAERQDEQPQQIEENAFSDFIGKYVKFINMYDKPDPVLVDQLMLFEGENLKELGAALCKGETTMPKLIDLGQFSSLNTQYWPDIEKITRGTLFSWYNKVPGIHEQQQLEFKIDIQVCRHLWESALK